MTSYTARALSTNRLQFQATEAGNTFIVGDILAWDGTNYYLADASAPANAEIVGMISLTLPGDDFILTQVGYITGLTGPLIAGTLYYLSPAPNSGDLTGIKPTAVGQVVLPCFIAHTTTAGWFFANPGDLIEPDGPSNFTVTTAASVNMAVNNGYATNFAGPGPTTFVLPAAYAIGDSFEIIDHSGFGFVITQTLGGGAQRVFDLGLASTAGAAGTTTTTVAGQTIFLTAIVANGALRVTDNKGTFTYA